MPKIHIQDWPPYSPNDQARRDNAVIACKLMMNAALTSPVTGGIPQVEGHIVYGMDEQEELAKKMEELAYENENWEHLFLWEAQMARESDAILFIGNYRAHKTPWDTGCGACGGEADCSYVYRQRKHPFGLIDLTDRRTNKIVDGPLCALCVNNMGYAVGGALIMATMLFVDTRPFMSMGIAGQKLGYCPNCYIVVGIPVSVRQKHEFRDIGTDYHLVNMQAGVDSLRKHISQSGLRPAGGIDYRGFRAGRVR